MLYQFYELSHAAVAPLRQAAVASRDLLRNPANPFSGTFSARVTAAAFEMFVNATRRYAKPEFELDETVIDGVTAPVRERIALSLPFCDLLRFERGGAAARRDDPPVLIIAPMSGHFATLLRGTVAAMLPGHDVYITDWRDARDVPLAEGRFGLEEYIAYLIEMLEFLHARTGERVGALGVCQPGVPLFAAAAAMAAQNNPARPSAMVLMGSPIDTRISPTEPTKLAEARPISWFRNNVITAVPWPHAGFMRQVYPGFLQLSGFMAMNLDRHVDAHIKHFRSLVRGDGESAAAHRKFYDEYLSVMDLTAEFYLETVERIFQKHELARGAFHYQGALVRPEAIRDVALMTIEGAKDDITGAGQTQAAHALARALPDRLKLHYYHPEVGHYGIFNGGRWRNEIQPAVARFLAMGRAEAQEMRSVAEAR